MADSDLDNALGLIARGTRSADSLESQTLDFKTDKGSDKETTQDLTEAAVCFANSLGGRLVVGVADRALGPEAFRGTSLNVQYVRARIHALTEPPLVVSVEETEHSGARLLIIRVPEGLDVYATKRGLVTRRWGTECLPMRPTDVSRLDDERRGADWTSRSSGRPTAEADPDALLRLRILLRGSQDESHNRLAIAANDDLLNGLRLIHADGTLSRAGEILLCTNASDVAADVLVYQYRQTSGGEAAFAKRWGTPMVVAFAEAMNAITARIGFTPVNTVNGQQIQVEDYPTSALREAMMNALLHGDYRERRPVLIEHSPESVTVRSPGPLVAGITPDNILTVGSRARFPLLAGACRSLGLAEELGQGVDRMFREMARTGRSTPRVEVDQETDEPATIVTFTGGPPNVRVTRFVADLPEIERNDTDTLLIVLLLCRKKSVTARDVAPIVQRDLAATEAVLRRLASGDAQILEPTAGTTARVNPNYRLRGQSLAALGPAVAYHRRSASDVDRKVVEHVREYDTINSATVQRIFDVDVWQARDMLRNLVGRELLIRVSEQRRGTAVKYGAGPLFPDRRGRR